MKGLSYTPCNTFYVVVDFEAGYLIGNLKVDIKNNGVRVWFTIVLEPTGGLINQLCRVIIYIQPYIYF